MLVALPVGRVHSASRFLYRFRVRAAASKVRPAALFACTLGLAACASGGGPAVATAIGTHIPGTAAPLRLPPDLGVVVMAHGGGPDWNASVSEAVAPLRERLPMAIAFGMANPVTMQAALDSVTRAGAQQVAVVRLFLSGASFLHQTEYLLGLRDDPPEHPILMNHGGPAMRGAHSLEPLRVSVPILLQKDGLSDHDETWRIAVDRAEEVSVDRVTEEVLLLAHGAGAAEDNRRILDRMESAVAAYRAAGFRDAAAFTLREDWPEARAQAEEAIRRWVTDRTARGSRVIVVPYRLSGFGPYAEVLHGLEYMPADGLLPHPLVTSWIEGAIQRLSCARIETGRSARCIVSRAYE